MLAVTVKRAVGMLGGKLHAIVEKPLLKPAIYAKFPELRQRFFMTFKFTPADRVKTAVEKTKKLDLMQNR